MLVKVGTFNLNNLFSRFNFQGAIDQIQNSGGSATGVTIRYEFTDSDNFRIRTFLGKLVKAKDATDTQRITARILAMDLDVLAVQEVENINILKEFNSQQLGGLYPHQVLIEGNDPRFIDVGLLSKFPLGTITSFQTAVHPSDPGNRVFGRDLLEVEILDPSRSSRLFTLYNNHLKSNFVPFTEDPVAGAAANNARRKKQAEVIAEIIQHRQGSNSRFIVTGDMNDTPLSDALTPMVNSSLGMVNALTNPTETRPAKNEAGGANPTTTAWTHRFKASGQPPTHELYDQIWLSPALAPRQQGAFIDRRTRHGGDGSDHDPAWVELDILGHW